jgi:hypothetical protein
MRVDWLRLIVQSIATLAGGIGAVNLGRLTTPDSAAGPWDLAGWVGLPVAASVAAAVGQGFMRGPAATGKPGSPGHAEFCQSVYELAKSLELDRLQALVKAWQQTGSTEAKP